LKDVTCVDGYGLIGTSPAFTCTVCNVTGGNCNACDGDATKCTVCKPGFRKTDANVCEACTLADTCLECAAAKATCTKAKYGYKTDGTACTAGGFTSDGTTATCAVACPLNCENCMLDSTKCTSCKANFKLNATTNLCEALTAAEKHISCATANGTTADNCLTCDPTVQFRTRPTVVAPATLSASDGSKCVCKDGYREPVAAE